MHPKEPEIEFKVYNKLTRLNDNEKSHSKWTFNLFCCCLVVAMASLQFGYNISSMNSATSILKKFISREFFLFAEFKTKSALFALNEGYLLGNQSKYDNGLAEYEFKKGKYAESRFSLNLTEREEYDRMRVQTEREYREKYNMTVDEYLSHANKTLHEKRATLEGYRVKLAEAEIKVNKATGFIWTITNCLFVVGGMTGTFTSKFLMDILGRKKAILIHHMFSILAAALVLASSMFLSPVCVIISRFLFGVQGGMSCTLVPTYLAEISPAALRGRTGVVHQLFITIGIVVAQVLGFRQIFASEHLWWALLAMPAVPAIIGFVLFLIFMPESPRALLGKDEDSTRAALVFLRNSELVDAELEELMSEAKGSPETNSNDTLSAIDLFKQNETFWPILTSLALHITQQLSGINAIFFYSSSIFKDAGISDEYIQYAILSTGIVNVITTIICVPLIDKLGRKPLLIYPMIFMIIDFICLILLLTLKGDNMILSYLSILCIMLFVISFAIGLGPIPFIYTAECFRQNARSSAMALSTLTNWSSGLLLTLIFPFMLAAIQQYVFIFFLGVVLLAVVLIINKVPETKGKSIEEIIAKFTNFKTQF